MTRKRATPPRKRRTAEEARTAILDAAERRLVEAGPAGIRLQDVAAEVGVSHPTVLHHFGNREALVQAVLERVQQSIYTPILETLRTMSLEEDAMARLLDRVFEVVEQRGHARVIFWLSLQGADLPDESAPLRAVVEMAHELRRQHAPRRGQGGRLPPLEDTRFAVVLATLAMTAKSVLGRHLFENIGLGGDEIVQQRFRAWLAKLLVKHLESFTPG
ncbi:MAG TPA: TetR/AcrR family transcriptional regulator [Labilithrix sp.]|jgi:AcrR family transcriptional regulator|nr:TetR/AcrR family transcriptional regulator [Labilithrix sp.]